MIRTAVFHRELKNKEQMSPVDRGVIYACSI